MAKSRCPHFRPHQILDEQIVSFICDAYDDYWRLRNRSKYYIWLSSTMVEFQIRHRSHRPLDMTREWRKKIKFARHKWQQKKHQCQMLFACKWYIQIMINQTTWFSIVTARHVSPPHRIRNRTQNNIHLTHDEFEQWRCGSGRTFPCWETLSQFTGFIILLLLL